MKQFRIGILEQHWASKNPNDLTDLCSHGSIELMIGNEVISNENDDDWTLSTSGLMLLRTLNLNHTGDGTMPLILHCGMLSMLSCPICIDWKIEHLNNQVLITEVKKFPSTNEKEVIKYSMTDVIIDRTNYLREVIRYCDTVKYFFKDKPRTFTDPYSEKEWNSFWSEFDKLLKKGRSELKNKNT